MLGRRRVGLGLRLYLRHDLTDEIVLLLFDAGADFESLERLDARLAP